MATNEVPILIQSEIQYVLTVPAFFDEISTQCMKEAAKQVLLLR